jgi:hypothetical protein
VASKIKAIHANMQKSNRQSLTDMRRSAFHHPPFPADDWFISADVRSVCLSCTYPIPTSRSVKGSVDESTGETREDREMMQDENRREGRPARAADERMKEENRTVAGETRRLQVCEDARRPVNR